MEGIVVSLASIVWLKFKMVANLLLRVFSLSFLIYCSKVGIGDEGSSV